MMICPQSMTWYDLTFLTLHVVRELRSTLYSMMIQLEYGDNNNDMLQLEKTRLKSPRCWRAMTHAFCSFLSYLKASTHRRCIWFDSFSVIFCIKMWMVRSIALVGFLVEKHQSWGSFQGLLSTTRILPSSTTHFAMSTSLKCHQCTKLLPCFWQFLDPAVSEKIPLPKSEPCALG